MSSLLVKKDASSIESEEKLNELQPRFKRISTLWNDRFDSYGNAISPTRKKKGIALDYSIPLCVQVLETPCLDCTGLIGKMGDELHSSSSSECFSTTLSNLTHRWRDPLREVFVGVDVLSAIEMISGDWGHICASSLDDSHSEVIRRVRVFGIVHNTYQKAAMMERKHTSLATLSENTKAISGDNSSPLPNTSYVVKSSTYSSSNYSSSSSDPNTYQNTSTTSSSSCNHTEYTGADIADKPSVDRVYLPPTLLFNLRLNEGQIVRLQKARQQHSGVVPWSKRPIRVHRQVPPLAARVTLSRVRGSNSSGYGEYTSALREYFSTPRVLSCGDILCVPAVAMVPEQQYGLSATTSPPRHDQINEDISATTSTNRHLSAMTESDSHTTSRTSDRNSVGVIAEQQQYKNRTTTEAQATSTSSTHETNTQTSGDTDTTHLPSQSLPPDTENDPFTNSSSSSNRYLSAAVYKPYHQQTAPFSSSHQERKTEAMHEEQKEEDAIDVTDYICGEPIEKPVELVHFQVTELQPQDTSCSSSPVEATLAADHQSKHDNTQTRFLESDRHTGMLVDGQGGRSVVIQAGAVNAYIPQHSSALHFIQAETRLRTTSATTSSITKEQDCAIALSGKVEDVTVISAQASPAPIDRVVFDTLEAMLFPILHPAHKSSPLVRSLSSTCTVLFHGTPGSGKRLLLQALAHRFGVHLKEICLRPLRGLPDERAAKKLETWLDSGRELSPCILHLRHLHALLPVQNNNGGEGGGEVEGGNNNGGGSSANGDHVTQVVRVLQTFLYKNMNPVSSSSTPMVLVLIATCDSEAVENIPLPLRQCFTHDVKHPLPLLLEDRMRIISYWTTDEGSRTSHNSNGDTFMCNRHHRIHLGRDMTARDLALQTVGKTPLELQALLASAGCFALSRMQEAGILEHGQESHLEHGEQGAVRDDETQNPKEEFGLTLCDVEQALDTIPMSRSMVSDTTQTKGARIPQVTWDDVGGLLHAKQEILDVVELPLQHPELFAKGVRQRSGILLYGPPGTGKTLLAKAVATECTLNFISVKGPELLDMYIGESERKVRQVFESARNASPCVLFFDELDSLAPQRGRGADSGGVMDRVVSQLLTELDGMQGNTNVFVIGATNRPDLLDQSLLRPGRFDRLIYLGICNDKKAQLKIVQALSRKFSLHADVQWENLLDKVPNTFTGADFYALCSGAIAQALKRRVLELKTIIQNTNHQIQHQGGGKEELTARKLLSTLSEKELEVTVCMDDYLYALASTIPSVSQEELKHYESLRDTFSSSTPSTTKMISS